jgi:hypothetical protein
MFCRIWCHRVARRGKPDPGYGVTGSGKTTLAAQIAERTGLPWHSVDDLTWEPDWVGVPFDEQRMRIEGICSDDRWSRSVETSDIAVEDKIEMFTYGRLDKFSPRWTN